MTQVKLLERSDVAQRRGLGCIQIETGTKRMRLPLKSVELSGRVADRLAHVTVKETFSNPFSEHLEAVYIFPLSGGCAVSSFEMRVADRVIKGVVEERAEARAQYAEAIQEGKRAALLEQERDDVFTVQVGNLPPGEEISVVISYSEKLPYFEDGTTEIRLPLVVAPRYIPGSPLNRDSVGDGIELDTDQVPDASRITPPRLAEGANPKIALDLKVVIAGDQTIEDLCCSQHVTKMGSSKDGITVSLSREDDLLDRDFVLQWRVATDSVQSKFLIYKNPEGKGATYGMLSLVPPKCTELATAPRDVIFVVDRSGSMNGIKMVSAARACSYLLSTLTPRDKFAIQAFDTAIEWMRPSGTKDNFVSADEAGIQEGMDYLRTITARGGTSLDLALRQAIQAMAQRKKVVGRQPVIVVLTDGEIGNESQILANIQKELSDIRVFSVGIDTAVNDGFLKRLAAVGGGTATFVAPGTQLEQALSQVSKEIGTPIIEHLSIKGVQCVVEPDSMAPEIMPDLFEGRAITSFFVLGGDLAELSKAKIVVKGQFVDGTPFQEEISGQVTDVPALAQLWAKTRIVDIEDEFRVNDSSPAKTSLHKKIVEIAKQHSLLTKFTAFVVVDQTEIVNADGTVRKVVQPVHTPALWKEEMSAPQQQSMAQAFLGGSPASPAPAAWGGSSDAEWGDPGEISGGNFRGSARKSLAKQSHPDVWSMPSAPSMSPPQQPMSSPPPAAGQNKKAEAQFDGASRPKPDTKDLKSGSAKGRLFAPAEEPTLDAGIQNKNMPVVPARQRAEKQAQELILGNGAPDTRVNTEHPAASNVAAVKSALEKLAKILADCFQKIKSDELPDADALEKARTELIASLANSTVASSVPELQKYLRSDLIKLIAAIAGASGINKQLKTLSSAQEKTFESLQVESSSILESTSEKPFWTATV